MLEKKNVLNQQDLETVTAGAEELPGKIKFLPAPPIGFTYCSYAFTCPNFDYRVCIFSVRDIRIEENSFESARGCVR